MTEPRPLTAKQQQVVDFIAANSLYMSPTYREIQAAFGFLSINAVTAHIRALERKGVIRRKAGARCLEVIA